jgi:hypothetical protein
MPTPSIAQLRQATETDLITAHDSLAKDTVSGVKYYLDELARREQNRQAETMLGYTGAMLKYTRLMALLTGIVTVATIVSVIAIFLNK